MQLSNKVESDNDKCSFNKTYMNAYKKVKFAQLMEIGVEFLQSKEVNARETNTRTNRGQNIQNNEKASKFDNQSLSSRQPSKVLFGKLCSV